MRNEYAQQVETNDAIEDLSLYAINAKKMGEPSLGKAPEQTEEPSKIGVILDEEDLANQNLLKNCTAITGCITCPAVCSSLRCCTNNDCKNLRSISYCQKMKTATPEFQQSCAQPFSN